MIVWISIDNSADRLNQILWAECIKAIDKAISSHCLKTYASMVHSSPTSSAINCHWCVEIPKGFMTTNLKAELAKLAKIFILESIAWSECRSTQYIDGVVFDNESFTSGEG